MLTDKTLTNTEGDHWLPLPEVCRNVGGTAATIHALLARDPTFPRPIQLGHANRWSARELAAWMEARLAAPRVSLAASAGETKTAIAHPAAPGRRPRREGSARRMLTTREIDAAKSDPAKEQRLSDAQNLWLLVRKNGSKLWRWDYAFQGRRNSLSFGVYPIVTLARAREKKRAAQVLLDRGIDPGAKRREERQARNAPAETFAAIAEAWVTQKERTKKPRTIMKLRSILNNHLLPILGARQIGTLTAQDVMGALRPIDEAGTFETAHRALSIVGEVFTYARAHGRVERDITENLSKGLTPVKTENYPAITDPAEIGRLLRSITSCNGSPIVCAALRFAPLVFVRAGELRGARWSEFDLADRVWRIPAARMSHTFSNGPHHVIPLARQALAILAELEPWSGGGTFVFPSLRHPSRPLSDMALTAALRRLGYGPDEQSVHGFRTIAGTRLREIGFPDPLVELQLAHKIKNPVEAAYNKATMLERRAEMMQRYADHLDELREKADRADSARRLGVA